MNFNNDEMNLMCIYDTGDRMGLINALSEMRKELGVIRNFTHSQLPENSSNKKKVQHNSF